jgi:hypothetical protein
LPWPRRVLLWFAALALLLSAASITAAADAASARGSGGGREVSPLASARGAGMVATGRAERPPAQAPADPRFGVAVGTPPSDMPTALQAVGASIWYAYDNFLGPQGTQAALIRSDIPYDLDELARRARAAPGGVWLIGNEPNTGGQDDISPDAYADFVAHVATAIRAADPTAVLVGPNILNWDQTCVGCPGFMAGRLWSESFVASYYTRYGPLPFDAWGVHAYVLDWSRLPMVDAPFAQTELAATRAWLDRWGLDLPIWLTEFGVIYGWEGLEWVEINGDFRAVPQGRFRNDLIGSYLDQMLDWLTRNGPTMRIERWFLYTMTPTIENWATRPVGLALLEPDSLTPSPFGQQYRNWSLRAVAGGEADHRQSAGARGAVESPRAPPAGVPEAPPNTPREQTGTR